MKISKSKRELARIISENGGWSDGYSFSAQNCGDDWVDVWFFESKPARRHAAWFTDSDNCKCVISGVSKLSNWHQTIISREEYFNLYPAQDADGWIEWNGGEAPVGFCELVDIKLRGGNVELGQQLAFSDSWSHHGGALDIIAYRLHKPEKASPESTEPDEQVWTSPPTIEQLAADYRNAKDYAERKQKEADAAKADAEAKLAELVAAGKALGLVLSVAEPEPEPELVITDWRDWMIGDLVELINRQGGSAKVGEVGEISKAIGNGDFYVDFPSQSGYSVEHSDIKFISRP